MIGDALRRRREGLREARAELARARRRLETVAHAVHEEAVIAARSRADLRALIDQLEEAMRPDTSSEEETR